MLKQGLTINTKLGKLSVKAQFRRVRMLLLLVYVSRKSEADRQGPALPQLQKILCRLSRRRCYFFENSISESSSSSIVSVLSVSFLIFIVPLSLSGKSFTISSNSSKDDSSMNVWTIS